MASLVSILIPAYNAERWIADTIQSALRQTWNRKEIIIVDDGSQDRTFQIAAGFESKNVKVVTQDNMGACGARNKALDLAQGDYIQWLDADDLLAPDKIKRQLENCDGDPDSRILLTSAWGKFYFRYQKARFIPNSLWKDLLSVEWMINKFVDNVWMNPASWLVSRKLIELAGPWDERLIRDNDGEYICRVVAKCEKVKFFEDAKSYYRIGNLGSLSTTKSDNVLDSLFLSINLSINHLLSLEDSNRTRQACVNYIQNRLSHFYPEKSLLLKKAHTLARSLGGELLPPSENLRFFMLRKIFGWRLSKRLKYLVWKNDLYVRRNFDRVFGCIDSIWDNYSK